MSTTPELIESLVARAAPVRRLRHPLLRALLWTLFAAIVFVLLGVAHGLRPDLSQRLAQGSFVATVGGALGMAVLAAAAAFLVSLPDRSRYWVWLPLPALGLWLSTIGYGCLTDWVRMAPDGMRLGETARCFATLALMGVPLSLSMLVMLRHAARWRPTAAACMGALAAGGFTAAALSLLHDLDASLMVLVWNLGTVALFVCLAGSLGPRMLRWIAPG